VFLPADPPVAPVQGTTWLDRDYCLGSVNRGDFWVQRRPLLAYWGGIARPARSLQVRFIKDDYDFASALLFTVQERNYVAGLVNFRSPGGDKHVSLDPIREGAFTASSLRLSIDLAGVPAGATVLVDGKVTEPLGRPLPPGARVAAGLGGANLWFQVRQAVFGKHAPRLSVQRKDGGLAIIVELLGAAGPLTVRWSDVPAAYLAFTLAMSGAGESLADFDRRCAAMECSLETAPGRIRLTWATAAGELTLAGGATVASADEQNKAFQAMIDRRPVPLRRLSDERLL
jgi:hypothetical protein